MALCGTCANLRIPRVLSRNAPNGCVDVACLCLSCLYVCACRCGFCAEPISSGRGAFSYQMHPGDPRPYHTDCYKHVHHPVCAVCGTFIPAGPDGRIAFKEAGFWRERYCHSHTEADVVRCCACSRLQKKGGAGAWVLKEKVRVKGRQGWSVRQGKVPCLVRRVVCVSVLGDVTFLAGSDRRGLANSHPTPPHHTPPPHPLHRHPTTILSPHLTSPHPPGEEWAPLPDGRPLCLGCLGSVVLDTADAQPLYGELMDWYRADMRLPHAGAKVGCCKGGVGWSGVVWGGVEWGGVGWGGAGLYMLRREYGGGCTGCTWKLAYCSGGPHPARTHTHMAHVIGRCCGCPAAPLPT